MVNMQTHKAGRQACRNTYEQTQTDSFERRPLFSPHPALSCDLPAELCLCEVDRYSHKLNVLYLRGDIEVVIHPHSQSFPLDLINLSHAICKRDAQTSLLCGTGFRSDFWFGTRTKALEPGHGEATEASRVCLVNTLAWPNKAPPLKVGLRSTNIPFATGPRNTGGTCLGLDKGRLYYYFGAFQRKFVEKRLRSVSLVVNRDSLMGIPAHDKSQVWLQSKHICLTGQPSSGNHNWWAQ